MYNLILKEFKLLYRDPAALLMLFILPMLFIFVLSIALQGTFSSLDTKEKLDILVINKDKGSTGQSLIDGLNNVGYFNIITKLKNKDLTLNTAKNLLQKGKYKIILYFPENTTKAVNFEEKAEIQIFIDPVLSSEFSANITNSLQNYVYLSIIKNISNISNKIFNDIKNKRITTLTQQLNDTTNKRDELIKELDEINKANFNEDVKVIVQQLSKSNIKELNEKISELQNEINEVNSKSPGSENQILKSSNEKIGINVNQIYYTASSENGILPNSVQQNVPGWTIFALFWIVQFLAVNIITERQRGAFKRILISPVSTAEYFAGKIIPFLIINLIQAFCMFSVGIFILPLLGCPKLIISNPAGIFLITLGISLSAISFGLMISSISKSLTFAASFSAAIIILMTVVGGIMVPKFIMPKYMQLLSYLVPHGWALDGYINLIVKDYNILQILPNFIVLLLFSIIFATISMIFFKKTSLADK